MPFGTRRRRAPTQGPAFFAVTEKSGAPLCSDRPRVFREKLRGARLRFRASRRRKACAGIKGAGVRVLRKAP